MSNNTPELSHSIERIRALTKAILESSPVFPGLALTLQGPDSAHGDGSWQSVFENRLPGDRARGLRLTNVDPLTGATSEADVWVEVLNNADSLFAMRELVWEPSNPSHAWFTWPWRLIPDQDLVKALAQGRFATDGLGFRLTHQLKLVAESVNRRR